MTDLEFQKIMNLKKEFVKDAIKLPNNGEMDIYDLVSKGSSDKFFLDVDRRGRIELSKFKLQNRYAATKMPLVRIDIDSPPHMNPDGTKTSRNHIHIYRELDHDTGNLPWAYDLESLDNFKFNKDSYSFMDIFSEFCDFCNISMSNVQGVI